MISFKGLPCLRSRIRYTTLGPYLESQTNFLFPSQGHLPVTPGRRDPNIGLAFANHGLIPSAPSLFISYLLVLTHSRSRLLSHTRFKYTSTAWWYINLPQPLTFFWKHPLYANMIPSFRFLRILGLLLFIHSVFASERTPQRRSRLRLRSPPSTEAHSLVKRAAPSGWTLYVKSGNDGGGCYIDSSTRILTGYSGSSTTNSLDSCLNTCKTKGFSYGGVENGNQCFVSSTPYRVNIDK